MNEISRCEKYAENKFCSVSGTSNYFALKGNQNKDNYFYFYLKCRFY